MPISKELYQERKNKNICVRCGETSEINKTLCLHHLQKANENQQAMYARRQSKGLCRLCGQKLCNNRKICNKCLEKQVSKPRDNVYLPCSKRKELGLCISCGKLNSTLTDLAIDHINGKGNAHRKGIKKLSSVAFYRWLIDQKFPSEFQLLCYNCNMSKHLCGGICAHKSK